MRWGVAVFAGALFCKIIGHYLLCVLGGCNGRCGGAFSFAFAALMHPNRTPQNPYGKFEEAWNCIGRLCANYRIPDKRKWHGGGRNKCRRFCHFLENILPRQDMRCAIRRGVGAPNRPLRPVFQRKLENHCWGNLHMLKKIQSPIDCKISTFRLFHIKGCWLNFFAMRSLLLF